MMQNFSFTHEDLPLLDPDKILNEYVDWTDTLECLTSSKEESKTKRLADKQTQKKAGNCWRIL